MTHDDLEKRVAELEKTVAALKPQSALAGALAFVMEQALIWFLCLGLLLFFVPPFERMCMDWNMQLPAATLYCFRLTRWVSNYWYLLLPVLLLILGGEGILLAMIPPRRHILGRGLRFLNVLLPLLLLAFVIFAIGLPLAKLLQGLSDSQR